MPKHVNIADADAHEPKHITSSSTGDHGKIITPSSSTAGESELVRMEREDVSSDFDQYGELDITSNSTVLNLTAASDSTLKTNGDYVQVTGIFDAIPHGLNNGVTQGTNKLTIDKDGDYDIDLWATTKSDTNSTTVGFKYAVNGTIQVSRTPKFLMKTAGDYYTGSAGGTITLSSGDELTLHVAATTTNALTIEDAVFMVKLMRAT